MAKHGTTAILLMASLLIAIALSGADARLTAVRDNVRVVTLHPGANGGYKAKAAPAPPAVPVLTCQKVHGVQAGETCFSVAQGSGLSQDNFLAFNPNINCDDLFVGQWICLKATTA